MKHPYKSEADLCDAFVEAVKLDGWKPYPECGGFDLLLVKDGVQVGVEAKLRANCDVLAQVLDCKRSVRRPRPHYLGVLVPGGSYHFRTIAGHLGVHVWDHSWITVCQYQHKHGGAHGGIALRKGNELDGTRIELPEVAIQTSAGKPSPKVMSPWRAKALKICLLYERQGYLTRADIVEGGVDPTRWTQYWMRSDGKKMGHNNRAVTKYVPKPGALFPSVGYEPEMDALRALEII